MKSNPEKFREMMDKRHRERKLIAEQVHKSTKDEKSKLEGLDYFEGVIDEKALDIENRLNDLQPSGDIQQLTSSFHLISCEIQELQKYLTNSTIFLNDYSIKKYQNQINQLILKADETKTRLIPKKKFGFKNKSAKPASSKTQEDQLDSDASKESQKKEYLWTISKTSNKRIVLTSAESNDQDITLSELENCVVEIQGRPGTLHISKVKNCVILCGPVSRSIFAENCQNCTFAFICQQLRLHSSKHCEIYLHVTSRAIIEDTTNILVTTFNYSYENFEEDLLASGLNPSTNNWQMIGDFNWLSTDQASPNWSVLNDCDKIDNWTSFLENFCEKNSIA